MSKTPITLEQVLGIFGLETQFTTHPNISKKQLLKFYSDVSSILRDLDEEINYEGDLFKFGFKSFKSLRLFKALQFRTGNLDEFNVKNVIGTHNIEYRQKPTELSEDFRERLKNNMYGNYLMINPNLTITSTSPTYVVDDLVSSLKALPYVGISDKYDGYVFNPEEVITISSFKDAIRH